jgi:hypothetical protein
MLRSPRIPHAQVLTLSRLAPVAIPNREWTIAAIACALLLAGLLGL